MRGAARTGAAAGCAACPGSAVATACVLAVMVLAGDRRARCAATSSCRTYDEPALVLNLKARHMHDHRKTMLRCMQAYSCSMVLLQLA
jgi:hypothetical protein